jgi:hypothetical protein
VVLSGGTCGAAVLHCVVEFGLMIADEQVELFLNIGKRIAHEVNLDRVRDNLCFHALRFENDTSEKTNDHQKYINDPLVARFAV